MELPSLPPIPESAARSHSCELSSALDAEHGESGRSRPASSSRGRSSDEPPARPVDWQDKVRVSNHLCLCRGADGALPSLRRPCACAHQLRATSCVNVMRWTNHKKQGRCARLQVHDWSFDIHAWAQHEPDFFCMLIMELLRRESLLVRSALLARLAVAPSIRSLTWQESNSSAVITTSSRLPCTG